MGLEVGCETPPSAVRGPWSSMSTGGVESTAVAYANLTLGTNARCLVPVHDTLQQRTYDTYVRLYVV